MQTLNKTYSLLNYGDEMYNKAVNYSHSLYNYPITLNYGEKHKRSKYILGAGTSDNITLLQDGIFIYVIAKNNGLDYISLQVINTELKEIEGDVFLSGDDISEDSEVYSSGILNLQSEDQLKILFQYL